MKYSVILASRSSSGDRWLVDSRAFVSGTEERVVYDTEFGAGQEIWTAYLSMRRSQTKKGKRLDKGHWTTVIAPEGNNDKALMGQFREAINIFHRFAAEGRDTCTAVKSIEIITFKPELHPARA